MLKFLNTPARQMRSSVRTPLALAVLALSAGPTPSYAAAWSPTQSHGLPVTLATTALPKSQPVHIAVSLSLRNVAALQSFIANQSTAGNPQYGQVLSSAQFNAQYAPTQAQVDAVTAYLRSSGFSNIRVAGNRAVILADGSAGSAQTAFNMRLARFVVNGVAHFANVTDIQVPSTLNGIVLAVLGLNDVNVATTNLRRYADARPGPVTNAGTPSLYAGYNAAQYQSFYNAGTTPTGSGTTIGIVTAGDDLSTVISDLRVAEARNKLPVVPVKVTQTMPVPNPQDASGDGEWDLDSQSSTGIAGNVQQVIFYNTASLGDADLLASTNQFATDNIAKAGNMSYGGCEALNYTLGSVAADDQSFMQAIAQGQTWFASSGDAGAACSIAINLGLPDSGLPDVEYPASSPYVVAVGGTTAVTDANYAYVAETSWDGGGGGTSTFEPAPAWQKGIVPGAAVTRRGVPDIAMDADPNTGAEVITNGTVSVIGGTSLSSPLSAGVWTRLESARCNAMTFAAPLIYALDSKGGLLSTATGFHDILAGTNGGFVATPGWDYTTGFGTFDITAVNAALPAANCPANHNPVAVLAGSASTGPAPLAVSFDGSGSSDPDADPLVFYVLDFGDGSAVATQSTPIFPAHSYAAPGTYTASLTVRDSRGGTSVPTTTAITVAGVPYSCVAPGAQIITSPAGVDPGTQGKDLFMATDDLLSTKIAEPADQAQALVFTMKVDNLKTVLPALRWVTYFTAPDQTQYYVSMDTTTSTTPSFTYGTRTVTNLPEVALSLYSPLGTLASSSGFTPDGTITLVLDKTTIGLKTGDSLSGIASSVRTSTAANGAGLTQDTAGDPQPYTLLGNDTCAALIASGGTTTGSTTGGTTGSTTGGTTGGSTGGTSGGTTGGTTTGGTTTGGTTSGGDRLGGGAFGGLSLLPLGVLAAIRRRRRHA